METIKRRAGTILCLGLLLGLAWTVAVGVSLPNGLDPSEACAQKVVGHDNPGHKIDVQTQWFPPRATCDFGDGDVKQYVSTTRSTILSVIGVAVAAVLATGLILTVRRFFDDPGPIRPADGVDLRRRKLNHLMFGALDVLVVTAVLTFFNAAALIFGGIAGGLLCVVASIVALSALGTTLDRHVGPLPSTTLDSRRRGTVAGATVFAVIFAATAISGQLPFFRLWAAPLAAVTYVVVVAVQWSRLPLPRRDHQPAN